MNMLYPGKSIQSINDSEEAAIEAIIEQDAVGNPEIAGGQRRRRTPNCEDFHLGSRGVRGAGTVMLIGSSQVRPQSGLKSWKPLHYLITLAVAHHGESCSSMWMSRRVCRA